MINSDYSAMVLRTVTTGNVLSLDVHKDIRASRARWTRGRTL